MTKKVTLGPFEIKGADAKAIRRDAAKNNRRKEQPAKRQLAKQYPGSPGARNYLRKTAPKNTQARRERQLRAVGTGRRVVIRGGKTRQNTDPNFRYALNKGRDIKRYGSKAVAIRDALSHATKNQLESQGSHLAIAGLDLDNLAVGLQAAVAKAGAGANEFFKNNGKAIPAALLGGPLTAALAQAGALPKVGTDLLANAATDALSIPANAVPSAFLTGRAAYKVTRGDNSEAKALVKSFKDHDPIALAVQGKFGKALKEANERPVSLGLEIAGGISAAGRASGAAGRRAPVRVIRNAASTQRRPVRLQGHLVEDRRYSKDLTRKTFQVAADRRNAKKYGELGRSQSKAGRKVARLVDEEVSIIEGARRTNRDRLIHENLPRSSVKLSRKTQFKHELSDTERSLLGLVADRTVRSPATFRMDLYKHGQRLVAARKRLEAEPNPRRDKLEANQTQLDDIARVLKANVDPNKLFAAAAKYEKDYAPIEAGLVERGVLEATRANKSKLVPYAIAHMDARPSKKGPVDVDGNLIPVALIERHMAENGVAPPSYYAQAMKSNFKSAAYVNRFPNRGQTQYRTRTGEASAAGSSDASHAAMYEHAIRAQGLLDWVKGFDRLIGRFGARRHPSDKTSFRFQGMDQARRFMETEDFHQWADKNGYNELVPVRVVPFTAKGTAKQKAMDAIDGEARSLDIHTDDPTTIRAMLDDAVSDGPGPVVLMPKEVWDRLRKHYTPADDTRRAMQATNRLLKRVVLPLSVKWHAGNNVDNTIRLAINGAGPRDYGLYMKHRKELQAIDPKAALELDLRVDGGMHFGSMARMQVHRTAEDFKNPLARALHAARESPGAKQVGDLYAVIADASIALGARMERGYARTAAGRVLRQQHREITRSWAKGMSVQPQAIKDAAQGLRGTNAQIQLGRSMADMLGEWKTFGPTQRKILYDYLTFGAWAYNATKFVFWTLPAKHPVKTALIVAMETLTLEERRKLGLDSSATSPLPDFLQGSVPARGGLVPTQTLTSFGFASDPLKNTAGMFFSPGGSPYKTLLGVDWKGDRLRNADGSELTKEQQTMMAIYFTGEALIPLVSMTRRIREQGGKAYGTSTAFSPKVKPGSKKGGGNTLLKLVDPFRPVTNSAGGSAKPSTANETYDWSTWGKTQGETTYDWKNWKP